MKFVEAILSNNTTDDHCREFVTQKGLVPLLGILGLPNLPVDFPASASCQAVAAVCKSILVITVLYYKPLFIVPVHYSTLNCKLRVFVLLFA